MTIKAAFFDVDGTLFSHATNSIPESTKKAFTLMHQKGIKLFTATGRHILELRRLPVKELSFDGYVTLNGQIGLDSEQKIIFDNPIDEHDTKIIAKAFSEKKMPLNMVEDDKIFINYINDDVKITLKRILSPLPKIDSYNHKKIYQCMTYGDGTLARELIRQLPACKLTQWNPLGFDIIPQNGSKMVGIQKMLKHFDLKKDEIIAFGDGDNDLEMLKFAGISVAMGNGINEVKQISDYVTDDIDRDGIYNALKHFNII